MTTEPRVPLYDRLPEIYRTRDAEQVPAGQLRAFLAALEGPLGALHDDITQLYDDLFIDTCDDWVVPYLADLLGSSHLKGEPRTLRADVADTIALRRRKGTLGAVERLAANLTGWTCRAVELRENLGWSQHLNHQRPDAGGAPPLADPARTRFDIPRGGTATLRDPATLALLGTAFDPFAYTADLRPTEDDRRHINLPNLAVFLWRLAAYRVPRVLALAKGRIDRGAAVPAGQARWLLRFDLHPLDLPVRLFNTGRAGTLGAASSGGIVSPLTEADRVPGPMLDARITTGSPGAQPEAYVQIDSYDAGSNPPSGFDLGDTGLQLYLPQTLVTLLGAGWRWRFRGDNLCAWETGLRRPVATGEVVIDSDIGRVLIGLDSLAQADALMPQQGRNPSSRLFAAYTYGAVGPVGAHPVSRGVPLPTSGPVPEVRIVGAVPGGTSLHAALAGLDSATTPVVIELHDSLVHPLDLAAIAGTAVDGGWSLRLAQSLTVRAASGQRPIVLLAQALGLRPVTAASATPLVPAVRLEGLYLAPGPAFPAGSALIERAAVARLELIGCTLAPGGHRLRDGSRAPAQPALRLAKGYGFTDTNEEQDFVPTPDIVVQRSVTGRLEVDRRYRLDVAASIVDAAGSSAAAIGAATDPATAWGAALDFDGLTCFGAVRVAAAGGLGAIFTQRVEAEDHQHGCIKWSAFSGGPLDRLPPNHFCVHAPDARIVFTSRFFNDPGYGQLAQETDRRVREQGPDDDAMGAFGFLLEAHKRTNLQVRLREFMPVGVTALTVPMT